LQVGCSPPGIGANKFRKVLEEHFVATYKLKGPEITGSMKGSVTLERAVIDLRSALVNINSSALEVAWSPAGNWIENLR
jgi:hypothetical protein